MWYWHTSCANISKEEEMLKKNMKERLRLRVSKEEESEGTLKKKLWMKNMMKL